MEDTFLAFICLVLEKPVGGLAIFIDDFLPINTEAVVPLDMDGCRRVGAGSRDGIELGK